MLASWADGAKRLGAVVRDVATHEPSGAVEGLLRAAAGPLWKAREAINWATAAYERRQGEKARPDEEDRKASQTPEGGYRNRDQIARDITRAKQTPRTGGAEPSGYDVVKAGIENGLRLDRDKASGRGDDALGAGEARRLSDALLFGSPLKHRYEPDFAFGLDRASP